MNHIVPFPSRRNKKGQLSLNYLRRLCKSFGMRGYSNWSRTEMNKALRTRPTDCRSLKIYAHSRKDTGDLKTGTSVPTGYSNCFKFRIDEGTIDVQPDHTGLNHIYGTFHATETVDEAIGLLMELDSEIELLHYVWK